MAPDVIPGPTLLPLLLLLLLDAAWHRISVSALKAERAAAGSGREAPCEDRRCCGAPLAAPPGAPRPSPRPGGGGSGTGSGGSSVGGPIETDAEGLLVMSWQMGGGGPGLVRTGTGGGGPAGPEPLGLVVIEEPAVSNQFR